MAKQQPNWHPINMLPVLAQAIDGMVQSDEEQLETLSQARTKPYVLDDHIVNRIKKVFTTQSEDFWVFDEQLRRWSSLSLTPAQQAEVKRLQAQMAKLAQINQSVLTLAEELSKGTIEKQLAKSDFDLGLEMLQKDGEGPFKNRNN